jgi:predicted nucleotidyltransferase
VELADLLADVTRWALAHRDVLGLALVGSHARERARADSDVDLVILCADPPTLIRNPDWITRFGEVERSALEDYGALRSLRVFYRAGPEVEFGITSPAWAAIPLDPGTRGVISGGMRVLYDPRGLLERARRAAPA